MQKMSKSTIKKEIHPAWRGIGCVLIVVIPVLAFALAELLFMPEYRPAWLLGSIPPELRFPLVIPTFGILEKPITITYIVPKLGMVFAFSLGVSAIFTIVYSLSYRAAGGYRPGPADAPPIRRKVKKSR